MNRSKAELTRRLKLLPSQSHPLAMSGIYALTADGFPTKDSYCQMFARLAWEEVYGQLYKFAWRDTAVLAAHAWRQKGFEVPLSSGSVPGDLLYRLTGNGGFGHVGIRVAGNMVAENSVVHGGDGDARGLRTMREFGDFDMIIRPSIGRDNRKDIARFLANHGVRN